MYGFFKRQSIVPFETAMAFFAFYSGIAGILDFGIINYGFQSVLGRPASIIFNSAYILAGISLYLGIGFNRRNVEAFGIILIAMSLVVRSIALLHFAGFSPLYISTHVYSAAFMVACAVRLGFLLSGKIVVEAESLDRMYAEIDKLKVHLLNRAR